MSWIECDKIHIKSGTPSDGQRLFFSAVSSNDDNNHNQWQTMSVSGLVPEGTKAVYLQGILIITHGTTAQTADMRIVFRSDESVGEVANYTIQCIEAARGSGQRSTASIWVPLADDMTFQWKWQTPDNLVYKYPQYAAYAANLAVIAAASRSEGVTIPPTETPDVTPIWPSEEVLDKLDELIDGVSTLKIELELLKEDINGI